MIPNVLMVNQKIERIHHNSQNTLAVSKSKPMPAPKIEQLYFVKNTNPAQF